MPRRGPIVLEYGHWPANKGRALPSHRNAGLEVVLVTRGQLVWHVEGRAEPVAAGSAFYTFPWEVHGSVREREPGCELYFAVLALDRRADGPGAAFGLHPAIGLSPRATAAARAALLAAPRRSWPGTGRLAVLMPELVAELGRADRSDDAVAGLARAVVVELHRGLSRPAAAAARAAPPPAAERVRRFVARLGDECHRPWPLGAMADACGLGRTRFAAVLKELTGDTPRMALNRARVGRATRLLTATGLPVTRIALDCGFASSQHFANVFRAYAGTTASRVRGEAVRRGGREASGTADFADAADHKSKRSSSRSYSRGIYVPRASR